MLKTVIRKEHKNDWEKRTALVPSDAAELVEKGFPISVEPSEIRIYSDADYLAHEVPIDGCPEKGEFVIGIKEPPVSSIQANQVHLAFSHTIKGQDYNMALLQKFIDEKATLFDYEPIVDESGKRTIAFGRFAGIAGAIDSFFVAGQKHLVRNEQSCLTQVKQTWEYGCIEKVKQHFDSIDINAGAPVRVLVVGTGNVGKGSEEVCQWLGLPKIDIQQLLDGETPDGSWYAVASSRHINRRKDGGAFDMQDFIEHGVDTYESTFDQLLGQFNILLQTPYWTEKYPKHLDQNRMLANQDKLPLVVGDISCDINGSLECTTKASDIDTPAFTYDVEKGESTDGVFADGITVMSIDNLPCELSLDASQHFSNILKGYMENLMSMDLSKPFDGCGLISELARAVIVYNGKLTPDYQYLQSFLDEFHRSNS
ncbi:alanine dehydrogenase [Aliikangiella coralliicola]|uniref:Alanine dehydrogenase n=1 Tax=Aliikangiella coralliicola TaxID=2592383 RepID=A0A545U8P7_9GAMM|nr:alanine dehydrogenase [Aliikangiella coralliicola]TQV85844.1 alanine dehydrogenase [Aliikangiella coralliicola]